MTQKKRLIIIAVITALLVAVGTVLYLSKPEANQQPQPRETTKEKEPEVSPQNVVEFDGQAYEFDATVLPENYSYKVTGASVYILRDDLDKYLPEGNECRDKAFPVALIAMVGESEKLSDADIQKRVNEGTMRVLPGVDRPVGVDLEIRDKCMMDLLRNLQNNPSDPSGLNEFRDSFGPAKEMFGTLKKL